MVIDQRDLSNAKEKGRQERQEVIQNTNRAAFDLIVVDRN